MEFPPVVGGADTGDEEDAEQDPRAEATLPLLGRHASQEDLARAGAEVVRPLALPESHLTPPLEDGRLRDPQRDLGVKAKEKPSHVHRGRRAGTRRQSIRSCRTARFHSPEQSLNLPQR